MPPQAEASSSRATATPMGGDGGRTEGAWVVLERGATALECRRLVAGQRYDRPTWTRLGPSYSGVTCSPLTLRAGAADSTPVVQQVARGSRVEVAEFRVVLLRPGGVVVRRRLDVPATIVGDSRGGLHRFAAGDTALLLEPYEGDEWQRWRHGRVETGLRFWARESDDTTAAAAVTLAAPLSESWQRIVPRAGRPGRSRVTDHTNLLRVQDDGRVDGACPD